MGIIQGQKRAVRSQLKTYAHLMTPGWYYIETQIAYRAGASPPQGLMEIKGHRFNRRHGWRAGLKSWVINRLVPPNFVRLRGNRERNPVACDQLLLSAHGNLKLFTSDRSAVFLHVADKDKRERLLKAHQVLRKYLPVTKLEIANDNGLLKETFAAGSPLHLAPREVQYKSYRRLIEGYICLTREESSGPYGLDTAEKAVAFALEVTKGLPVHELISQRVDEVRSFLAASPLVPSHGDMYGNNILVSWESEIRLTIIDLEGFGVRPFFVDVMTLPVVNHRYLKDSGFLQSLVTGRFDEQLDGLFLAAGLRPFSEQRVASLLAVFVVQLYNSPLGDVLTPKTVRNWSVPFHTFWSYLEDEKMKRVEPSPVST